MPEAPRLRPEKHSVLHTFTAHVRASPDSVFAAVESRVNPGPIPAYLYLADPVDRIIVSQGGWWYRGEYRITGDGTGAILEHVIVNVAQRGERAALVTGRKVITTAPLAFHDLVKNLRTELEH